MIRRIMRTAAACLATSLLLSGCWDLKHVQDLNYLTGMGFDYVDDQYVVYVQMIDFTSVAKLESGKSPQQNPVWVGIGKGQTPVDAIGELYRTSQLRIFYGQVNSIIFSENMLKKGLKSVNELRERYYELRYTPWVFGTKEPVDEVFAATPFFNLSPTLTILHQPRESYLQHSRIAPLKEREFLSSYHEPGKMTYLPSVSIKAGNWKNDGTPKTLLEMNGRFLFQNGEYKGWLEASKTPGLRWLDEKTNRSPVYIRHGKTLRAGVYLESPKVKITPVVQGTDVTYSIHVQLHGVISELMEPIPETELSLLCAEEVKKEIMATFREGLKIDADLLQLEHNLYRKHNRQWKMLREQEKAQVSAKSLKDVQVSVIMRSSGKLKYVPADGSE